MPQPNLNSEDYYEILGCSRDANDSQLKKAYRKLAVKWHPDKNPDNTEATNNFQKISEAYAVLSDPKKRKLFNQYGIQGVNAADNMDESQMPQGGFGGFPGGGGGGGVHHMSEAEAQAFFSQFFGGSDPFMGGFGGPSMSFSTRSSGFPSGSRSSQTHIGSNGDPFSMMFNSGMGQGMRSSNIRSSRPSEPRYDAIPPGTIVSLKDLVNAPDRNGDIGQIKQYVPSTGRYVVQIEDSVETMSVKPSNLLQHLKVRIHDIQNQPELNGKTGTVLAWNQAKERYNIYVNALEKVCSLKAGNVIFDTNTVARVTGLNSRPELNGKWGTIIEWIRESNKYDVQLSPQHVIRVKVENMRV